ncbi:ACP S-malonyltransferase [Candidatus Pelagibacter sp.]|nr:ACP S-malonyltransferase [Candidatus Pelagibacter sp.]
MFSLIFPGQGSQTVGMCREFYKKFDLIKTTFKHADEILNYPLTKIIFEGPKEELDFTENTQPAIFLVGHSIFSLLTKEFEFDISKTLFFAGHSLGEYTALNSAGFLQFEDTLKILKIRGKAMQLSVPKGEGGMIAVLGTKIDVIENLLKENINKYECYIANDNTDGQLVLSGKKQDLDKLVNDLNKNSIKNIVLPVSAPFHCKLMNKATEVMKNEIEKLKFETSKRILISNVTGKKMSEPSEIKRLLVEQIESRVRWRESIKFMIENGTDQFIEIGPGKVLSGLVKRIDRNVKVNAINNEEDINMLKKNYEF